MNAAIKELNKPSNPILSPQEIQKKLSHYTEIHSLRVLPQILTKRPQWILWKAEYIQDKDKVSKIPINPMNYRNASSTDPGTWTSFNEAMSALRSGYGLGFVLAADDGLTGIDIDKCITDGTIEPWAQDIINSLNSYTESLQKVIGSLVGIGRDSWRFTRKAVS